LRKKETGKDTYQICALLKKTDEGTSEGDGLPDNDSVSRPVVTRRQMEAERRITGYDMRITCGARDIDGEVKVGSFANNIKTLMGWEIQVDDGEKSFNALFRVEGDSQQEGYARIEELEDVLLALSVKNKVGCEILTIAWGAKCAGQPFAIWAGRPESVPREIDHTDVQKIRVLREKGGEQLLSDLGRFYGRVTHGAKIIFGFSLLEMLFDEKPSHILSKDEITDILRKATEIDSVANSEAKQRRLQDVLSNPNLMPKKNRNERIATKIAALMNIPEDTAYAKIRALSQLRAAPAHSTKERIEGISQASTFIEEVLLRYMMSLQQEQEEPSCGQDSGSDLEQ